MAAERRTDLDWTPSGFPSDSQVASEPTTPVSAASVRGVWSSAAVQSEMLSATAHGAAVWDQPFSQRTGSRNSSEDGGGVASRVETDANANRKKDGDCTVTDTVRPSSQHGVERTAPEVTSEVAAGSHVFSDIDYHVLRRHVMQGDLDDHVVAGDRKSLDNRESAIILFICLFVVKLPA